MQPGLVIAVIAAYFLGIFVIAFFTSKGATSATFFSANKESPWYIVAFGMIGASLSGVTFISVPGWVGKNGFEYFQIVLGYVLGYMVITGVLLPLYYRLNLVSIYTYLEERFGFWSYKTGALFFLVSRLLGSSLRLYLVSNVLQLFIFDELGVPFWLTVFITIALIWSYTFRGGIKTVLWTDIFQTTFMLGAMGITIWIISQDLGLSLGGLIEQVSNSKYSTIFHWDAKAPNFFWKQFFSGAFITIVMTGLDQDMMQKNLTCRTLPDAQKNMLSFTIVLVFVNLLFLILGASLYLYAEAKGIALPALSDELFPMLAKNHFGQFAGIVFIIGVVAAAYSSADSALTALTTSFCVDFLDFNKVKTGEARKRMRRIQVHLAFSFLSLILIYIFKFVNNTALIDVVFKVAGYTYGPLLGLFSFGLFTNLRVRDRLVPFICILSPILCYAIDQISKIYYGYTFGYELLIMNGLLTFLGLLATNLPKSK